MAAPNVVSMLLLTIVTATVVGIMNVASTDTNHWCVARSDVSSSMLQPNLDYACGHGADCSAIQPGGSCFNPNTVQRHASYAFNSYYQRTGRDYGTCYFNGTSAIVETDPSYGSCKYQSTLKGADTSITERQ